MSTINNLQSFFNLHTYSLDPNQTLIYANMIVYVGFQSIRIDGAGDLFDYGRENSLATNIIFNFNS